MFLSLFNFIESIILYFKVYFTSQIHFNKTLTSHLVSGHKLLHFYLMIGTLQHVFNYFILYII